MIKIKAYAKLNLNLHIIPQLLKNGLYPVKFINCQINLFDELSFVPIKKKIEGVTEDNLVYKAAVLLKKLVNNEDLGVRVYLKKNIPTKAGLGGGSSDAAATIIGLAKLWKINLSQGQLDQLAGQLGKDVFYCLKGGICEVLSDGSVVHGLKLALPKLFLMIVIPNKDKPSTAWMYQNLDRQLIGKNLEKFKRLKKAISDRNKKEIIDNLFNDFESLAIKKYPFIEKIKDDLVGEGALKTLLAGSGLAIVGFFVDKKKAVNAFNNLKDIYKNILWTETI